MRFVLVLGFLSLTSPPLLAELRFPQPQADAGMARTGQPLSHRFAFVNAGSEPIEISDIRASCGCLTPRLERRTIQPGEKGCLLLEVKTLTQPAGKHAWNARILYESAGQKREVEVRLSADLITEVSIQPAVLVLSTTKAIEHELILTDVRAKPLGIVDLRTSTPGLNAEVVRATDNSAVRRVRVAIGDDFPDGRHEAIVTIYTDDPDYRELRVPVTVVKRARLRVIASPDRVTLSAAAGQPLPSRIVLLRDEQQQPVIIEKIVADNPAVMCTWAKGPNTMATVRIRVDRQKLRTASLDTKVHLHLSRPTDEVVTIPVRVAAP